MKQVQKRQARRTAEYQYRDFFEGVPVGLYRCTPQGQLRDVNPALVQLLGYPNRAALLAVNMVQLFVDRREYQRWQSSLEDAGVLHQVVLHWRRSDGSVVPVETNSRAVRTVQGQVAAYQGSIIDITPRRQVEEALRQSEVRFRRLFESHIIGLAITNRQQVLEANDTFLRTVGYTREDLLAGHVRWREMTPPELRYKDDLALEELLARGECTPYEKAYIRKDGSRVPILIGAVLLDRPPLQWLCFMLDLTARKRIEDALRQREDQLQVALEAAHMGLWDWNLQTDQVTWSAQLERLYGFAPGTFPGTSVHFLNAVHPEDRPRINQAIAQTLKEGGDHDLEFRIVWPDGTVHRLVSKGRVLKDRKGRAVRMVGVQMQVSATKQAEEPTTNHGAKD